MIDQRFADHASGAGNDVQNAGRQSCFERQLADAQCGKRSQFGGLHHDGAAAGQRRRQFPHPDHQREIPGHDGGNDANRLPHGVGERFFPRRDDLAADLVGPAGVVSQRIDGGGQVLPQHARDRLAGIEAFKGCDLVGVLLHQVGQTEQDLTALRGAHAAPGALERATRCRDGAIDVGLVAFSHRCDDLFVGRIEGLERATGGGRDVPAVDQQQPGLGGCESGDGARGHNHMQLTSYFLRLLCSKLGGYSLL